MATKTVLTCVIQYLDDDDVRLVVVGWDEADPEHQSKPMREAAIKVAGLEKFSESIQSIRFVEIEMPIVEAIDPTAVVVRDVA
jgi:hypothetical protein